MKRHLQYLRYLANHKYHVFVAGWALGVSLWRLIKHDWTKFTPSEWGAYTEFFYGADSVKIEATGGPKGMKTPAAVRDRFDRAWLSHQRRNDHHFQHYILHEDSGDVKVLEMGDMAVREMVADWFGAGRAITGKWEAQDWFYKNRGNILLNRKTLYVVEDYLRVGDRILNRSQYERRGIEGKDV